MLHYILLIIIILFIFFNYFYINEHINYNNISVSDIQQLSTIDIYHIPPVKELYQYIIPNLTRQQLTSLPTKTLNIVAGYLTQNQIDFLRNYQNFNIPFRYRDLTINEIVQTFTVPQLQQLPPNVLKELLPYLSNDKLIALKK